MQIRDIEAMKEIDVEVWIKQEWGYKIILK